jgi:hypothetical protein
MASITPVQWADVRALWISTSRSTREIASEYGIAESAIRKRAAKELWGPRNAPERKRAMVNAALAGAQSGAQCALRVSSEDAIQGEANQDIEDMSLSASVGRGILRRCAELLKAGVMGPNGVFNYFLSEPKDLKATADAARAATDMIRRVRGLDEPGGAGDVTIEWGEVVERR